MIPVRPDLTRRMAGGADANSYHGRAMAPPPVAMAPPARIPMPVQQPTTLIRGVANAAGGQNPALPVTPAPAAAPAATPMVAQAPIAQNMQTGTPLMRPGVLVR